MGMYDYLGGKQIKAFYIPVYNDRHIDLLRYTWHSGGILRDLDENLPLKTIYYKYPDDFIVLNFDMKSFWIIKDRRFVEFKSCEDMTEQDLKGNVYGYYGALLNVNSLEDFAQLEIDVEDNNVSENIYFDKWHNTDYQDEKELGELIFCLIELFAIKDKLMVTIYHNPTQRFLSCKSIVKKRLGNSDLVKKYVQWHGSDKPIEEARAIIKEED